MPSTILHIHDALETTYIRDALTRIGNEAIEVQTSPTLRASDVSPADFALIPTAEITQLIDTHTIDPEIGIWIAESGAISMRTPVRADEVEPTMILLHDVSGTAELLARATLWPFYGIRATSWSSEPSTDSGAAIVDGLTALEPIEAGFSEDLVRAWFILTEQPVVTHLLVIPNSASLAEIDWVKQLLSDAVVEGHARRRDIRKKIFEESSVEGETLVDFLARLEFELDEIARTSAHSLLVRGVGGSSYPLIRAIPWRIELEEPTEPEP